MGDAGRRISKVDAVATADSSGVANDALVNELKAQVNDLISKLQDAGLMEV